MTKNVLKHLTHFIENAEEKDGILFEICDIFKRGVDGDLSSDEEESKQDNGPVLVKKASLIS